MSHEPARPAAKFGSSSFFIRHGLMIVAIGVFLWPIIGRLAIISVRSNKNDTKDWLPAKYEETKQFKWFLNHFAGEEFALVSWDGCNLADERLKLFVEKIVPAERDSDVPEHWYFESVLAGPKAIELIENLGGENLKVPREEAIERLKGALIGDDGQTTCAVLTFSENGSKLMRKAVNRIRDVAIKECGVAKDKLHLGGPAIDNVSMDEEAERTMFRLAGIALSIGLVLSWFCLRSFRLVAMVFFAGIYALALSVAIVPLTGNTMNAILMTMPPLVYVAAISAAIHLTNYYRDSAAEHGLVGAAERALRHGALPLGLATATTAIGLVSLCTSELVPIQMFGTFSAIGVVASLLVLCLFLPACFAVWPLPAVKSEAGQAHAEARPESHPIWSKIGEWVVDNNGKVTIASIALLIFFGWQMVDIKTSTQLMRMFPEGARIRQDYAWLEQHLGKLVPAEVVVRFDLAKNELSANSETGKKTERIAFADRMRLVEHTQRLLSKTPGVGSTMSAATFAPPLFDSDKKRQDFDPTKILAGKKDAWGGVSGLRDRVKDKRFEAHRQDFMNRGFLAEERVVADEQVRDYELWRISTRVGALDDVNFAALKEQLSTRIDHVLGDDEQKSALGIDVIYTGLVPLIDKSQRSLLDGLQIGFITDLVVVTLVMMIVIREWSAGIVLLLPSVFPVFMVFGYMGLMGIIVDTGTVMAPGVALGVTIDDVVHFMLMYRAGLEKGMSRRDAIMVAYKGCARAMYQSWGVIGIGLSAFAFSSFMPTQRFGYLMVTLLTTALVGNLVVLPAVLAGPFGALFGRKFQLRNKQRASALEPIADSLEPVPALLRRHMNESVAK